MKKNQIDGKVMKLMESYSIDTQLSSFYSYLVKQVGLIARIILI